MSELTYEQFQNFITKGVKEMLCAKGSVSPHVLAYAPKQSAMVYIALPEDKNLWKYVTALGVAKSGADMYAFISEAWYVEAKPANKEEEKIMKHGVIMPSQHPDRKEGLFFIFYSRTEKMKFISMPFKRGSGAEIIFGKALPSDSHVEDARIGNVYKMIEKAKKEAGN